MLKPMEMEEIRIEVYTIKEEDLELRQKEVLNKLNQEKLINLIENVKFNYYLIKLIVFHCHK